MTQRATYARGLDVLGGGEAPAGSLVVVLHVNDVEGLARSQGALAGLAAKIAPHTVERKVYDEIAKQIADGFRAKGADVTVKVSEMPLAEWKSPSGGGHYLHDIAVGLGAVGVAAIVWRVVTGGAK